MPLTTTSFCLASKRDSLKFRSGTESLNIRLDLLGSSCSQPLLMGSRRQCGQSSSKSVCTTFTQWLIGHFTPMMTTFITSDQLLETWGAEQFSSFLLPLYCVSVLRSVHSSNHTVVPQKGGASWSYMKCFRRFVEERFAHSLFLMHWLTETFISGEPLSCLDKRNPDTSDYIKNSYIKKKKRETHSESNGLSLFLVIIIWYLQMNCVCVCI